MELSRWLQLHDRGSVLRVPQMVDKVQKDYYKSPLGWIELEASGARLAGLNFVSRPQKSAPSSFFKKCRKELSEYFSGRRKRFSLPLELVF